MIGSLLEFHHYVIQSSGALVVALEDLVVARQNSAVALPFKSTIKVIVLVLERIERKI